MSNSLRASLAALATSAAGFGILALGPTTYAATPPDAHAVAQLNLPGQPAGGDQEQQQDQQNQQNQSGRQDQGDQAGTPDNGHDAFSHTRAVARHADSGGDRVTAWGSARASASRAPAASASLAQAHTAVSLPATAGPTARPTMIAGHRVVAVYHMRATAYGPSLRDNYPYGPVDAFGQPLKPGMVAVDPSVIPLRSLVYVTGYTDPNLPAGGFLGQAMDTGGAIKGNRIDIFMNADAQTVSNFGIEPVTVYVLAP